MTFVIERYSEVIIYEERIEGAVDEIMVGWKISTVIYIFIYTYIYV